ncbi:MAG: HAD family hydrolase [Anaerolineae bacterium]|nr:HAD family hydrolase [Anaerolineae bacterium]
MPRLRTVVLDWGDTLMRNFPHFPGPMAHWPHVEAIPGAAEALAAARRKYRVVVATNAADSHAALAWQALARVGLHQHVDEVYTSRELGARKPDPAFFRAVLAAEGCRPREAAMVGDDYWADVVGSARVGMWAIWYNPTGASPPRHDARPSYQVIAHLLALAPALERIEAQLASAEGPD